MGFVENINFKSSILKAAIFCKKILLSLQTGTIVYLFWVEWSKIFIILSLRYYYFIIEWFYSDLLCIFCSLNFQVYHFFLFLFLYTFYFFSPPLPAITSPTSSNDLPPPRVRYPATFDSATSIYHPTSASKTSPLVKNREGLESVLFFFEKEFHVNKDFHSSCN